MSGLFVGNQFFFFFFFFFFFLQNKSILGNFVDWLWSLGWVFNTWFNRKFSAEQFSTLTFFHKNVYSVRHLQKTFLEGSTRNFKKSAGGFYGIFSKFFWTPIYTTFSNQTFYSKIYKNFRVKILKKHSGKFDEFCINCDKRRGKFQWNCKKFNETLETLMEIFLIYKK